MTCRKCGNKMTETEYGRTRSGGKIVERICECGEKSTGLAQGHDDNSAAPERELTEYAPWRKAFSNLAGYTHES